MQKGQRIVRLFICSRRFSGYCRRFDVYIDLLRFAAMTEKLAAENEDRCGGGYDHKNYHYSHDCRIAAAAFIITHKIDSPFSTQDSSFTGDVTVFSILQTVR